MTLTFLHPSLGLFIPKVGTATGPGTGGTRGKPCSPSSRGTSECSPFGGLFRWHRGEGRPPGRCSFLGVCRTLIKHGNAHERTLVRYALGRPPRISDGHACFSEPRLRARRVHSPVGHSLLQGHLEASGRGARLVRSGSTTERQPPSFTRRPHEGPASRPLCLLFLR